MIGIEDVSVRLGGARILDSVSATIDRGRLVGLVGPNGAGKTTLLRTINGRLDPDAGTVSIDGDAVADLSTRRIGRRVATVPQETNLSFSFDVRTVVDMGRTPHRGRFSVSDPGVELVDRAMERTQVADLADRPVTAVSGGERKRVLLARALAQDAPIMLLDEPTASLDVNHQVETLDLVRGLADEGKTVLAAIHDLDLAARFCDDLLLLANGQVQAFGPPEAVLRDEAFGDAFDTSVAIGRNPVTGSPTVTALPDHANRDGHVHVVCGGGSGAAVLYPLVAAGYDVSVGPLLASDVDAETANVLDLDAVVVRPFARIGEDTIGRAAAWARTADVVVLSDLDVGPENRGTLDVAASGGRLVIVEDRPFSARNHAGEDVARTYADLRDRAPVVSGDGFLSAVAEVLDAPADRPVPAEK